MTTQPIIIEVQGEPKAQPRARAFAMKTKSGGTFVRMYNPGTAEAWKNSIAAAAQSLRPQQPITTPVRLDLVLRFPRPQTHYRTGRHAAELRPDAPTWHTAKPDRDNCEKAIMDCLTMLSFWKDDSQVCCGEIRKVWVPSINAGATIWIQPATTAAPPPRVDDGELFTLEDIAAANRSAEMQAAAEQRRAEREATRPF